MLPPTFSYLKCRSTSYLAHVIGILDQSGRTLTTAEYRSNRQIGFTLIELLVVLGIIAVISTIVVIKVVSADRDWVLRSSAERFVSTIELARTEALMTDRTWQLVVEHDSYGYAVFVAQDQWKVHQSGPFSPRNLDDPFYFDVATTEAEEIHGTLAAQHIGRALIFNNGEMTPIRINIVSRRSDLSYTISCDGIQPCSIHEGSISTQSS